MLCASSKDAQHKMNHKGCQTRPEGWEIELLWGRSACMQQLHTARSMQG